MKTTSLSVEPIAVVGMAARFPGAPDIDAFWNLLCGQREAITRFTDDELRASGISEQILSDSSYVKAGGIIDDADAFDASFFGYSTKEAGLLDPQHRVFLECAWHALESCGRASSEDRMKAGVFASCGPNTYLLNNVFANDDIRTSTDPHQLIITGDKDFLATRTAYLLDMRGPSMTVQTACSSSLVAVHLACQSLRNRECELALAGGVALRFPMRAGYWHTPQGILSSDGHCRAFDRSASGTVFGNGVGIVVLKRLHDALADGDKIRAVVIGSAINNDGRAKPGYTAPSIAGQARVLSQALENANVEPDTITFFETHGTGTELGDAVEFAALSQVFPPRAEGRTPCALGAVKTNIGHLDAAAGIAGFIKTVLSLENREIPATLHFEAPGEKIPMAGSAFLVPTSIQPWRVLDQPRRAAVSALGIGGTNANIILEEPPTLPVVPSPESVPSEHVLVWSAKDEAAVDQLSDSLHELLSRPEGPALADLAYTLRHGREHFAVRRMMIAIDTAEALSILSAPGRPKVFHFTAKNPRPRIVFCFPGQGAGYRSMGQSLYRTQPAFRAIIDDCVARLRALGANAAADALLSPPPADEMDTALAQPVLFCLEYALAQWWHRLGITPDALLGHSLGEYVAACHAGVFELDDALRLVIARGALMQRLPQGRMLTVRLPEQQANDWLAPGIDLAAVNSPNSVVFAGSESNLNRMSAALAAEDIHHQWLDVEKAFHSADMDTLLGEFGAILKNLRTNRPKIPVISNVTGNWLDADRAVDADYWVQHLRSTVRFSNGAHTLLSDGEWIAIEMGPGNALCGMLRQQRSERLQITLAGLGADAGNEIRTIADSCGQLWLHGISVNWRAFPPGQRVALPPYPFQRRRHWIDPSPANSNKRASATAARLPIESWFHRMSWRRGRAIHTGPELMDKNWLLLHDPEGWSACISTWVEHHLGDIRRISRDHRIDVELNGPAVFTRLLENMERKPDRIVDAWTMEPTKKLESVLFLVQAVLQQWPDEPPCIDVILPGAWMVSGTEASVTPALAAVAGIALTARQEYPQLRIRCVDAEQAMGNNAWPSLLAALEADDDRHIIALRGGFVWHQEWTPFQPTRCLRQEEFSSPVYLITGGLGGVGEAHATALLMRRPEARIALVGRTALPPRESWSEWTDDASPDWLMRQRIERFLALERLSKNVAVFCADVGDAKQTDALIAEVEGRFGPITGWVHAAGELGPECFRPLMEMTAADLDRQWRSKVLGATHLQHCLQGKQLEFRVFASSLSTVLGGLGFAAYAAANHVLDAIAENARLSGSPVLSIAWDAWSVNKDPVRAPQPSAAPSIHPTEGGRAFVDLLNSTEDGAIAVAITPLSERLKRWVLSRTNLAQAPQKNRHPLQEPCGSLQGRMGEVALLWQEMLGVGDIGGNANFFELGGDSLVATHLMARINRLFGTNVPVRALFEHPTLGDLVRFFEAVEWTIDGKKAPRRDKHEVFEEGVL